MRIITHPTNLDLLKRLCEADRFGVPGLFAIEIVTNRHMDVDKPTGRYILPDGSVVDRENVRVPWGRFAEFGPEDIRLLLWWGVIREEREPLFYEVKDSFLRYLLDMPMTIRTPKYLVSTI